MDLHAVKMPTFLLVFAASASLSQACASDSPTPTQATGAGGTTATGASSTAGTASTTATSTVTGAGGSTVGSTATTGTGGTAGTGGAGGASDASPLPFVVDSLFIASGYMGDGATPGAILQDDNMTCAPSRPAGAVGHCHKFTYTPIPNPDAAVPWGGVYWQYPVNNWGALPGKRIAQGATKVTFLAAGAVGGESVRFLVGGILPQPLLGLVNGDTVNVNLTVVLTNTMTPYLIDLTGQSYDAVLGGFGWVIEVPVGSTTPVAFTVDSIRWEQ